MQGTIKDPSAVRLSSNPSFPGVLFVNNRIRIYALNQNATLPSFIDRGKLGSTTSLALPVERVKAIFCNSVTSSGEPPLKRSVMTLAKLSDRGKYFRKSWVKGSVRNQLSEGNTMLNINEGSSVNMTKTPVRQNCVRTLEIDYIDAEKEFRKSVKYNDVRRLFGDVDR